jgi:2-oxo-4-hydroxy-4-carboxy-5-ureidoimidazoline decarboxylase
MPSTDGAEWINSLPRRELIQHLHACLDVSRWVNAVADQRPFADEVALYDAADTAARDLTNDEIHTALAAHPRIGERTTGSWSRAEQSGVDAADAELTLALREGNAEYERRFGHIYLVCASGRSGVELLRILHSRLDNDPDTELRVVADELRKIARLRLGRLIEG